LLGVLEKNGHFYAAQNIGDNHIILHGASKNDLQALKALVGQEIGITSDNGNIVDSRLRCERLERSRGWSR
jgi:hypothetical protein